MEHYFTKNPTSELKLNKVKTILRNKEIEFYTSSGLFAKNKVDNGSKLLINKCKLNKKDKLLDLGCGYGIIGLTLLKEFPELQVTFSDINERAIEITAAIIPIA